MRSNRGDVLSRSRLPRGARTGAGVAALTPLVLLLGTPLAPSASAAQDVTEPETTATVEKAPYPGDPESESPLVAAEDDRITEVGTVDSLAVFSDVPLNTPYRLATGSAYTLVLTARREPYTVADLTQLAPQTFVRRPDGSYLLSEHLVVLPGAVLHLGDSGGLKLRLASDSDGFVSIVNYGGRLEIVGAKGAPVEISSFDREDERPDLETSDGRAYIRSIGGQVMVRDAVLSDLGFWSGRTGGLSLTGTDRPDSGQLVDLGRALKVTQGPLDAGPKVPRTLSNVLPAGELPVPTVDGKTPGYSYVSAQVTNTTIKGNAFGMFVSSANGIDIRDSVVEDSLVDGIVLHRFVTNAVIENTDTASNGGDGLVLARATTGIVLSEITAEDNTRNGVTISGLPLATGPSATGISVGSFGNNTISNSEMNRNGRYGVEVIGGVNVGVLANTVSANDMGIVVREGARDVDVVGNRVSDSLRQGISVRDLVKAASVSGNIVTGGETSVYVRDSGADVERNTFTDATSHAVALVGEVGATSLAGNSIAGRGPSAVDTLRAKDLDTDGWDNDTSGWQDTTPFLVTLKRFLQPLTAMWLLLGGLLVFTAVRGVRGRRAKQHPYADKGPVGGSVWDIRELERLKG